MLDAPARAAYRARLAELAAELDEAERWNDPERATRVRAERDFVADELGAALGRGGRPRTLATDAERARISVTRALRAAIDRIGRVDAAAGAHLAVAVRTGAFCSYHPERTELAERPGYAAAVRVLVTGGAGFIGSHVADRLAAEGHEPVVLDALIPQAHGGEKPPWVGELVHADVRDPDALREALRGIDAVCHQAAMVGHGVDASDAPAYAAHNDLGTAVLLAAMYEAGVSRLVLAGSMVVYGEGRYTCVEHGVVRPGPRAPDDIAAGRFEPPCPVCGRDLEPGLVPEDAPLDPRSTYAATKLAQEHLASAWARQTGGAVWSLRYHNVYGPRMPRDTPYSGVASVFRSALERGEPPRVMEDGRQRRDFVHVGDVAAANVLALAHTPTGLHSGERLLGRAAHRRRPGDRAGQGDARSGTGRRRRRQGGRRAARGGRPGPRDRAARLHRAGGVRRGRARVRHRSAARARRHRTVRVSGTSCGDMLDGWTSRSCCPAWTRPRRCPRCSRRCPRTGRCSSSTTARPTTRPRWPARGAPAWWSSHGVATARLSTPACGTPAPIWWPCWTATAPSTPRPCRSSPRRCAPAGRISPSAAASPPGPGCGPGTPAPGTRLVAALLRSRGVPVHDIAPIRVGRREALLGLGVADRAFGYPLELLLRAGRAGWRIEEVPVRYTRRAGGRSKVTGSVVGTARAVRDMGALLLTTR